MHSLCFFTRLTLFFFSKENYYFVFNNIFFCACVRILYKTFITSRARFCFFSLTRILWRKRRKPLFFIIISQCIWRNTDQNCVKRKKDLEKDFLSLLHVKITKFLISALKKKKKYAELTDSSCKLFFFFVLFCLHPTPRLLLHAVLHQRVYAKQLKPSNFYHTKNRTIWILDLQRLIDC